MRVLRIGIAGCGRIVQHVHLGTLARLPGVAVVALAEPDPQRRDAAGRRVPDARTGAHYHDLLERPDVDAVVIGLPTALHAEAAEAACRRGKHVYLEKPIATSLDGAQGVLAAWREAGVVGMIGFNFRFHPLYQALRRHIQTGTIGEVVALRSVFSTATADLPDWKRDRRHGGGVLLDLASHHVDLVHYLLGQDVCEVSARLQSRCSDDDTAAMALHLADGTLVQSFFSLCGVEEDRVEVYGQAGRLTVDRHRSFQVEVEDAPPHPHRLQRLGRRLRSLARTPALVQKLRAPHHEPSYRAALGAFVAAVRGGRAASPDFWDGYCSLAITAAAERSARTGRPVATEGPGAAGSARAPEPARALRGITSP